MASAAAAYDLHYRQLRTDRQIDAVGRKSFLRVMETHARAAEPATGRGSHPCLAAMIRTLGLSRSTILRARALARRLGLMRRSFVGRHRTLLERLVSWKRGDRGRGWASEFTLHEIEPVDNSTDQTERLEGFGTPLTRRVGSSKSPCRKVVTTESRKRSNGRASRDRTSTKADPVKHRPDPQGVLLAAQWLRHSRTPSRWTRHRERAWSRLLAKPAAHGWTVRDLHQLEADWGRAHVSVTLPTNAFRALGWMLAWHGDLDDRPAAAEIAAEESEASAAAQRVRDQLIARREDAQARAAGLRAAHSPAAQQAREAVAAAAKQARTRTAPRH